VPKMLPAGPDDFLVQAKYDGWNTVVFEGHVWTRRGNDITSWCHDWGFDLAPQSPVNGELLAEADGEPGERTDIPGIRTGRCLPRVVAFDLMLEGPPIEERLASLLELTCGRMEPAPTTDPEQTDATWKDINLLYEEARARGHEGLLLKRKRSPYHTSRETSIVTADWLKLRVPAQLSTETSP